MRGGERRFRSRRNIAWCGAILSCRHSLNREPRARLHAGLQNHPLNPKLSACEERQYRRVITVFGALRLKGVFEIGLEKPILRGYEVGSSWSITNQFNGVPLLFASKNLLRMDGDDLTVIHNCQNVSSVYPFFFKLRPSVRKFIFRCVCLKLIGKLKKSLNAEYSPDGFNIGMNCGAAAVQTVMRFHCHVIPRYQGDVKDPRGGVRWCIPSRGNYLADPNHSDV